MKKRLLIFSVVLLGFTTFSSAQDEEVKEVRNDSISQVEIAQREAKELRKQIEVTEKEAKAAEKEAKAAEKEAEAIIKAQKAADKATKKHEKLASQISSVEKGLKNDESKVAKIRDKMEVDKIKGKLSPNDIAKIEKKVR
ncbi:hypothetical protein ACU8V7_23290 [Zobellia nedashkovskayae]